MKRFFNNLVYSMLSLFALSVVTGVAFAKPTKICPLKDSKNDDCCLEAKCPPKKAPEKVVYKYIPAKPEVKVVQPAPTPVVVSSVNTIQTPQANQNSCEQCTFLMLQNQELAHKLELANRKLARLTSLYYGYRQRYYLMKDTVADQRRNYSLNLQKYKKKSEPEPKIVEKKVHTGGIYIGLAVGYGPDGIERNYEAETEYGIVKQNYKAIFGGRLMGITASGFGGGIQVMSNRSVSFDLDIRLK